MNLWIWALYEEEGHVIMDCPFVPFHIRTIIARHAEFIHNVVGTLMGQTTGIGTKNSCSSKQIKRHGVGKPIGTIESTNLSFYSNQEQITKGVFPSPFYTTKDTNG
jgi:hypothetical protein